MYFDDTKIISNSDDYNLTKTKTHKILLQVFIPAVHVFMQPSVINQRKKVQPRPPAGHHTTQRRTSCPDVQQPGGGDRGMGRNSSLPILGGCSDHNNSLSHSQHRTVPSFQRLQSVEEATED